jgi:GT2 family glycosyltransferase
MGYAGANNWGISEAKGQYIVLLNNDTVLLEQPKNQWLDMLELPFKYDTKVGVTGPIKGHSDPGGSPFIIFFCAMICRELIDKLKISLDYGIGGGEDTEYCYEAEKLGYKTVQVPVQPTKIEPGFIVGGFPIYHKGEATMHDPTSVTGWSKVFDENSLTLAKKYNPSWYKWKISNNSERAVFSKDDSVAAFPREVARYSYAASKMKPGMKVLEFGCSSGYGLKFFPDGIVYTGVDYDKTIIDYAKDNFDGPDRTFICCDANDFEFKEHYDVIVAYEFIEHIKNGKEFAQKLKLHCDTLCLTVPYMEPRSAPWGPWHMMHELSAMHFPDFQYDYVVENGRILPEPERADGLNLLLLTWEKGKTYTMPEKPRPRVLCSIMTKDRYDILSNCIQSVVMQTRVPDKIMICDDSENRKDLRSEPIYNHLFKLFDVKKIQWEVLFTPGKGQHIGHQLANKTDFDFVWRIDDDEIAEPTVLERLLSHMTDGVGAVGGAVVEPGQSQFGGTNKIADIFHKPNFQWIIGDRVLEVEHLYSSFLYRPGIVDYAKDLSPVAHREETLFSHELFRAGYKLIADQSIVTHHFRHNTGGIRSHASQFLYEHDDRFFLKKMEEWGIKVVTLNNGIGDHYAFSMVLPDLLKVFKHVIIGATYPEVFEGTQDITLTSVAATERLTNDNIYGWMLDHKWNRPISEAYRKMLGI